MFLCNKILYILYKNWYIRNVYRELQKWER